MLDWFRRKPPHPHGRDEDRMWLRDSDRTRGVLAAARQAQASGDMAVVIGVQQPGILRSLQAARRPQDPLVLEPHQLQPARLQEAAQGQTELLLLLVGAAGDPEGEEQLLLRSKDLPLRITLQLHLSLEEPVMAALATPRLRQMLERLGARGDEAIVHAWVSRSVATARRKAAR